MFQVRADPASQDQLVPRQKNIFTGGLQVQTDPASLDQLVPCPPPKKSLFHEKLSLTHFLFNVRVCVLIIPGSTHTLLKKNSTNQGVTISCSHNPRARDPRRQDQLVPLGCPHTKITRPWFVLNLFFWGAGCELVPGGRINSHTWVVRMQKM